MTVAAIDPNNVEGIGAELLQDWFWRINNLYYITDKDGNKVLFRLNRAQAFYFRWMHYRNIILKALLIWR